MNRLDRTLAGKWLERSCKETPGFAVPSRGSIERQLEELKDRLLQPMLESVAGANTALAKEIRWAATEAAALAWFTFCPILVLPELLEEKVRATLRHWDKQLLLLHG